MTLALILDRLIVFMKREFKIRTSFRMTAILSAVSTVSGLFSYSLLGTTAVVSVTSETYGMTLTAFLVAGVAFGSIVNTGLSMFYQYGGQVQAEEVLATPTDFREFLMLSSLFEIFLALITALSLFILSVVLLHVTYVYNVPLLALMILLGIFASIGLGLIGLSFQLVFKQTYVISWLFYSFSGIIGNMIVPVDILPGLLQTASYLTPQYYFFTGIRAALGAKGSSPIELIGVFSIYTIILLITGFATLKYALVYARRNGTLRWQ